jgi:hypothetical protein
MTTQLSNDIIDFLNLDTTRNFLVAAQQFVDILESENISKDNFLKQSHSALIDLYSAGLKLTEIELIYSGADSDFDKDNFFDNKNLNLISELGGQAYYFESFDPTYEKEESPSQGWLVDDFADIYQDLKIELQKLKVGTNEATEDALWQLKFSFRNHWGRHCINALRYLHYFRHDNKA